MDTSDAALERLAQELGQRATAAGLRVATAESCTGGWIAKLITDIAGSSGWFERGYVTYSNEAKAEMLGVPREVLVSEGAVSEAVVRLMAEGALLRARADLAVAVSGVAGPGGGSANKPVGTVWFAWARRHHETIAEMVRFAGDRDAVRRASVAHAMSGLLFSNIGA